LTNITENSNIKESRFIHRINELRNCISSHDPFILAAKTGTTYSDNKNGQGEFLFQLWENKVKLSYPDFIAQDTATNGLLPSIDQALILYYFTTADGLSETGDWISFSELLDGRFYNQAFQGYTGKKLSVEFKNNKQAFISAAQKLSGEVFSLGDASFKFKVLPRVSLLIVFWLGDEDFPSSVQILFDSRANHYLPTDAYAIIGSTITRRLLAAYCCNH
jgi:hypothetical protein